MRFSTMSWPELRTFRVNDTDYNHLYYKLRLAFSIRFLMTKGMVLKEYQETQGVSFRYQSIKHLKEQGNILPTKAALITLDNLLS